MLAVRSAARPRAPRTAAKLAEQHTQSTRRAAHRTSSAEAAAGRELGISKMPKASETGELHRHASQRSYAFHNNLHANAQSKSGPVLAILGAEPRTARAPKQHKGEGVVAQLDPKRPPQHYFAVVTQRYLTLTPLAPSKTIGSTGYARTRDTVVVKAKKAPEKKRVLEPSASWRPGRRGTIATPGTAAVIDERLENALEKEDDEEKEEEAEELEGWDSNMVNRIDLDEVRSIEAVPFSLRMATIAENRAEDDKKEKTDKNSLDSFEFADPELEAHAVHVLIDVEGEEAFCGPHVSRTVGLQQRVDRRAPDGIKKERPRSTAVESRRSSSLCRCLQSTDDAARRDRGRPGPRLVRDRRTGECDLRRF